MLTITFKPEVAEQITMFANEKHTDPEAIVDDALRAHLLKLRREKIEIELAEFHKQKGSLLTQYRGEYIAMYQGKVIDHDQSLWAMHRRVFEKLGRVVILMKKVAEEPERVINVSSPRFGRISK